METVLTYSHSITIELQGTPKERLFAALPTGAIDSGIGPIFGRERIPANGILPLLRTASRCDDDERFESLIFKAFELASQRSRVRGRRGIPLRMLHLKRLIERDSHNEFTLRRMASISGLSTFACLRQFKAATGTTPYAYLLACRIRSACALLCGESASIAEVALAAGFPDRSYFASAFKKSTGLTPMRYRLQQKNSRKID